MKQFTNRAGLKLIGILLILVSTGTPGESVTTPDPTRTVSMPGNTQGPALTPTPTLLPPAFTYPDCFPVPHGFIYQSSPFTLREKNNEGEITENSACLGFEVTHKHCRKPSFSAAGITRASSLLLALLLIFINGELFGNYLAGFAMGFLVMLGSLITGSGATTPHDTSSGVLEDDAQTRTSHFFNKACSNTGLICNDESYVFEAALDWGGYGWVTPEGNQSANSSSPSCLTRDPVSNTLSFRDCAYRMVDGRKKVLDTQLWKFTRYAYQRKVDNRP